MLKRLLLVIMLAWEPVLLWDQLSKRNLLPEVMDLYLELTLLLDLDQQDIRALSKELSQQAMVIDLNLDPELERMSRAMTLELEGMAPIPLPPLIVVFNRCHLRVSLTSTSPPVTWHWVNLVN